ncbi:hypothetical protein OTU49_004351, partial [Cherax quadricarinatus]
RDAEKKLKPAGYKLQWNYFYNDLNSSSQGVKEVPEYLWALRHTLTPTQPLKPTPGTFKSLFDMDVVRAIYSHSTLLCKHGGKCNPDVHIVPPSLAYIGHFKFTCGNKCSAANSTKEVLFLHKYKKQVTTAVTNVLKKLELI